MPLLPSQILSFMTDLSNDLSKQELEFGRPEYSGIISGESEGGLSIHELSIHITSEGKNNGYSIMFYYRLDKVDKNVLLKKHGKDLNLKRDALAEYLEMFDQFVKGFNSCNFDIWHGDTSFGSFAYQDHSYEATSIEHYSKTEPHLFTRDDIDIPLFDIIPATKAGLCVLENLEKHGFYDIPKT